MILLQVLFIGSAQPQAKPHETLEQQSVSEINMMFEEANQQIKQQEVILELNKISKNLNGTLIYAQNKDLIF
jgi:predicted transposase YdaD